MTTNPFSRVVDGATSRLGRFISWLTLCMVLIGAYNAIARYLGRFVQANLSSNLYLELQWYLFSLIFLLGAAHALREDAHVRVDVIYGRLRRKAKARVNVIGSALMLIPFCVFVLWVSWPSIRNSWAVREGSPDPSGLPRYPIKAVIIVAFVLLVLQGISQLLKDVAALRRPDDDEDGADEALDGDVGARGL